MAKTIVGLYDDRNTALRVMTELEQAGFGQDHLRFTSHETGSRHNYEVDVKEGADPDYLTKYGIPEDEAHFYAEGVRRGGSIVVARVHDQDVDRATDIMGRHNPVSYEQRSKAYQQEGFSRYDKNAAPYDADKMKAERERFASDRQQRAQVIEEELKVGKREVLRGGVRLHQHVVEEPVHETLRLRDEEVHVERTPVNRAARPGELEDAFQDKTIEMTERDEEAVIEKQARVVEEVSLGKEVHEREQQVNETVRRTEVDVENVPAGGQASRAYAFHEVEPEYRKHFEQAFARYDEGYDYFKPGYQYGHEMGADRRYSGKDYSAVENDLRKGYYARHRDADDSAWDRMTDAVRHGYEKARARLT